jgi:very-short-patch-repair endonuclease
VVVGHSAAALLGSKWIPPELPAELARIRTPAPPGIVVHSGELATDETRYAGGITCTATPRTAYDLGRRLPLDTSIIRIDALLNATGRTIDDVAKIAARYPGARNIRRLRSVLALVDAGAESPQETKTRLLLVRAGLTPIVTQIRVGNRRIDMGWPEYKVGVEYDGEQHWTNPDDYAKDVERLEFLAAQGWIIVRVSSRQLRFNPAHVVERVRRALVSRGYVTTRPA